MLPKDPSEPSDWTAHRMDRNNVFRAVSYMGVVLDKNAAAENNLSSTVAVQFLPISKRNWRRLSRRKL